MIAREELHASGFHWCNEQLDAAVGEFPKRCSALLLNFRVRREIFKGENVMRGETENFVRGERAGELGGGEEIGVERVRGLVVGDEDDGLSLGAANEGWKVESARGCGESGHTSPTRAARKMATHTLE